MTDQFPIIPPFELVQQWRRSGPADAAANSAYERHIATQAARWGADQELEACCEWVIGYIGVATAGGLRAARRPEPPSLKEQALDAWDRLKNETWCEEIDFDLDIVRRALRALPND